VKVTNFYYNQELMAMAQTSTTIVGLQALDCRDSPLLVAPDVALPLLLSSLFLFFSPVLLFHSSTHTHTHKDKRKKEKTEPKEEKENHKNLK
jgi:hypothetical protein